MGQQLTKIHIQGYKSLKEVEIELSNLTVLIGANGSGKSNFIGVFRFLRHLVEQRLQVTVQEAGGAERLLHYGSRATPEMDLRVDFPPHAYAIKLKPSNNDSFFIEEENVGLEFPPQKRQWSRLSTGETESKLSKHNPEVYQFLNSWRVYHFHDTSQHAAVKKNGRINDNFFLREDAANLAAFLYRMKIETPKHYERIVKTIQLVVPMFKDFVLRPNPFNNEMIRLEWLDKSTDYVFTASDLSDGSLRFICMTAMLLQPNLPDLILLDEPELGLHPSAITILAGLLRKTSHLSQLIISTQSAELVSEFEAENVVVVENTARYSTFTKLDVPKLSYWLNEYSLGEIWDKNIIGGRP
jgi:predicted ATPase